MESPSPAKVSSTEENSKRASSPSPSLRSSPNTLRPHAPTSTQKHQETLPNLNTPESDTNSNTFTPRDATEDEIKSLPHVVDKIPFAAWAAIFAGAAERFAYLGVLAPWREGIDASGNITENYLQHPRDNPSVPGALGLGQSKAVSIYNAFFLVSFVTPVFFAIMSDVWVGRYWTVMTGLGLYLVGFIVLFATSLPSALDNGAGAAGFGVALFFIALGAGSIKAAFFPFIGDQYTQKKPQVRKNSDKSDELVVVDGARTIQFLYNAYYWFTNVASLSSIPVTFLEVHYDFWAAYLLVAAAICVSIALFALWSGKFVKIAPQGNVLPKAWKTLVCAAKNGFKLDHAKPTYQKQHHGHSVPWDDHFIEEMKRGLIACRVIFALLVFYLCINQIYNNLVSQAGQMNLSGVPNDMIQSFSGVACILLGPVIQAIYNLLARHKIEYPPVARITTAFVFAGLAMGYAAVLQHLIYTSPPCFEFPFACDASEGGTLPNEVSVWLQLPLYFLLGVAEILGFVTAFEYTYSKAPKDMKAVVQAIAALTSAMAGLLGMAISPAAKDPNMVVFYACLAGAMGLSAVGFWWKFRKYDEIDRELNQLDLKERASSGSGSGDGDRENGVDGENGDSKKSTAAGNGSSNAV